MKTNKTNELDEILENMIIEFYPRTVLQEAYPAKEIKEINSGTLTKKSLLRIKQQINKWALEKCLGLIGEVEELGDIKIITEDDQILAIGKVAETNLKTQQIERARKEFSNE